MLRLRTGHALDAADGVAHLGQDLRGPAHRALNIALAPAGLRSGIF